MEIKDLKFQDNLIPAIVQDHRTGEVLMLAYMNPESVQRTLETGRTWFWSRSRQKYWMKGESSGHVQIVKEVITDCDHDTLLVKVEQVGPGACHTGQRSCFHNPLGGEGKLGEAAFDVATVYGKANLLEQLYDRAGGADAEAVAQQLQETAEKLSTLGQDKETVARLAGELLGQLMARLKAQGVSVDDLLVALNTKDL